MVVELWLTGLRLLVLGVRVISVVTAGNRGLFLMFLCSIRSFEPMSALTMM